MNETLLPQSFWFRLALPCRRRDGLVRRGAPGKVDLPESCRLAGTDPINGRDPWAEVRAAWSPEGLAFVILAEAPPGRSSLVLGHPDAAPGVTLWIDTRDTRDVSRATRFCHRFEAKLLPATARSAPTVEFRQKPIARALAEAPLCDPEDLRAFADRPKRGWRLDLVLSAEALNGYDPETNRRLGLAYQIHDPAREDQFLGVGREFPIGENPSLWSTLELRDDD